MLGNVVHKQSEEGAGGVPMGLKQPRLWLSSCDSQGLILCTSAPLSS